MPGEADERARGSAARPKIADYAAEHRFTFEAGALQALGEELLATRVLGRDGLSGDERAGEEEDLRLRHSYRS
jgi:hypothetical protein